MKTLLFFVLFLQLGPGQPDGPIHLPTGTVVCDGSETPCNPDKPWMRGTIEIFCGRTPEQVKAIQEKNPGVTIKLCLTCKHMCNPNDRFAQETGGVTWDGQCSTRCKTSGCECPRPCDTH